MAVLERRWMQLTRALIAAPALAMLSGCLLYQDHVLAEGVKVHVVDAATGGAVPGAVVTLMSYFDWEDYSPRRATTDPYGRVEIEAIKSRSYFVLFPQADGRRSGRLKVEATGYEVYETPDDRRVEREGQGDGLVIRLNPVTDR